MPPRTTIVFRRLIQGIVKSDPFQMRVKQSESAIPGRTAMRFITKKHLPRRTFLRGVGVTVALPLLDSMVPAQTPLARTAANPASRLSCIYVPHGATMYKWTPATEGSGFAFTETLAPLEKLRDRICVVSNLAHPAAGGAGSDAGADHARSAAVFLSGVHPERKTSALAHHRSDRRATARPGHAASFARTVHRRCGAELRLRLRLRLLQHHFLEDAHHASSHGKQPAGGVRKTFRRRQQQCRPASGRKQLSRSLLDSVMEEAAPCNATCQRRIARAWPSIWTTSAKSSAASKRPSSRLGPT
jgi:hypothetical protein